MNPQIPAWLTDAAVIAGCPAVMKRRRRRRQVPAAIEDSAIAQWPGPPLRSSDAWIARRLQQRAMAYLERRLAPPVPERRRRP